LGYVAAIADASGQRGVEGRRTCAPPNVTLQQDVDVVKRYLEMHPEQRQYVAEGLVALALSEAFPCPK
jgi:Rap1a immunity proteins